MNENKNEDIKNKSEDIKKDKTITMLMIVVQLLITSLVIRLFYFIGMSLMVSTLVGALVWSAILFKTPVFSWFFINVKANWAVILGNQTIYDQIPKGLPKSDKKPEKDSLGTTKGLAKSDKKPEEEADPRTTMYNLESLREVGPGLRGKFPWEVPFESVHLRSEIVVGSGGTPLKCYTKDNIERTVTWQVILTPLRGHLVNLVRKGEGASQAYFKGRFETKIREWMRSKLDKDVDTESTDLKDEFSKTFGGENQISSTEENYGMFTNTPQILTIDRSASYQKAAEAVMVAERIEDMIKKLKAQIDNADPNMLLAAATAIAGNDINGLLLIPGFKGDPQMLTALTSGVGGVGAKVSTKNNKGKP